MMIKKILLLVIILIFSNQNIYANSEIERFKDLLEKITIYKNSPEIKKNKTIVKRLNDIEVEIKNKLYNLEHNTTTYKNKIATKQQKINIINILSRGINDKVTNGDVTKLQKYLKSQGYKIKWIDGIFGYETEKAVTKLNKDKFGIELKYFDPRLTNNYKNTNTESQWTPIKVKEFLGYGTFDWFYLDFPFGEEKINSIYCGKSKKDYIFKNGKIIFPLSKNGPGKFSCFLNAQLNNQNKKFEIVEVNFKHLRRPTTHVNLIKKYSKGPSKETLKRISKERKILSSIYKTADKSVKFNSPFERPLDTEIISPFGKTRIFNNGRKSVHSGTDFRARTPLPVKAINSGEVVMANMDLYYCGKGVIINHGMNIFSTYCHLSENRVKIGDKVLKGQVIGLSGATGRVSGAHLHLSTKYNGGYVDFEELQKKSEIVFQ